MSDEEFQANVDTLLLLKGYFANPAREGVRIWSLDHKGKFTIKIFL